MNVALNINLHKNQEVIHASHAANIVCKCGKRFGKTRFAVYKMIKAAMERPRGMFWYIAPSYRHAKNIAWVEFKNMIPKMLIKRMVENELMITFINDAVIQLIGAENEDALRGPKLHGVVFDEAALIKEHVWPNIIRGQLLGSNGEKPGFAFFISSPPREGRNWYSLFYDEALRKKSLGDKSWDAFHFTIYDNSTLNKDDIDQMKYDTNEDQWEVEYMANESHHAGQIVSEFNFSEHVKEFENPKDGFLGRAIDWGIDHPTACLWLHTDLKANKVYVSSEYKKSGKGIDESCVIIKQITGARSVDWSVLGKDLFKRDKFNPNRLESDEFIKHGVPCIPCDTRDVGYDIMKMFFKKNMILIHPSCRYLIQEIKTIQWGDTVGEDLLDTLRYGLKRIHDIYFGGNLIAKDEVEVKRKPNEFNLNDFWISNKSGPKDFSFAYCEDSEAA